MKSVTFHGHVDIFARCETQRKLDSLVSQPVAVIDLRNATAIDATFLGQLAALRRENAKRGGTIVLVVTDPLIRKILSMVSFDRMFEIVASLEEVTL